MHLSNIAGAGGFLPENHDVHNFHVSELGYALPGRLRLRQPHQLGRQRPARLQHLRHEGPSPLPSQQQQQQQQKCSSVLCVHAQARHISRCWRSLRTGSGCMTTCRVGCSTAARKPELSSLHSWCSSSPSSLGKSNPLLAHNQSGKMVLSLLAKCRPCQLPGWQGQ